MTPTSRRTRVLLGPMPALLRDIVSDAIGRERRLELVSTLAPRERGDVPRAAPADVVIVGRRKPDLAAAEEIWASWPRTKVLVIADRGRRAVLYELRPTEIELDDVSPAALVAAILDARLRLRS